jgi:hypothetical protein
MKLIWFRDLVRKFWTNDTISIDQLFRTVVSCENKGLFIDVLRLEFGCGLQQAFYLLMKHAWRKKICLECAGYFIANRPTNRYCSNKCAGEARRKSHLKYWNSAGSDKRRELRKIERERKSTLQAGG